MSNFSDFISGGLPAGDKLRFGSNVSVGGGTTNTTILTVASGGGILHGVYVNWAGSAVNLNFKATIDGGSERNYSIANIRQNSSNNTNLFVPLPIKFKTSLTLKADNSGANNGDVQAMYHIK